MMVWGHYIQKIKGFMSSFGLFNENTNQSYRWFNNIFGEKLKDFKIEILFITNLRTFSMGAVSKFI